MNGHRSRSPGFTLVEILMVLAIMGIMTLVAMPTLVKSIRGNRLRTGTGTVVMAANYARTSAILRNQEMKLGIDKENGVITVEPLRSSPLPLPEDHIFKTDGAGSSTPPSGGTDKTDEPGEPQVAPPPFENIYRKLDAVTIESFTKNDSRSGAPGDPDVVIYQSNGRCQAFEVTIADEYGSKMHVAVNAVGSAKVTQR